LVSRLRLTYTFKCKFVYFVQRGIIKGDFKTGQMETGFNATDEDLSYKKDWKVKYL